MRKHRMHIEYYNFKNRARKKHIYMYIQAAFERGPANSDCDRYMDIESRSYMHK